jgi:ribosomal protein S21
MSVRVKDNNVDFALRKFKTEIAREGTLSKARERADGYRKPGVRRRDEKKINTINSRKNNKYRNN